MSRRAREYAPLVFLLDVDNTLLDNDALIRDLMQHLEHEYGAANRERYSQILEQVRARLGYVDYLGALQQYRDEHEDEEPSLLKLSSFLVDYPFRERLFPEALEVIAHLSRWGPTVILSDGDVVFQPRKIQRSGLWEAVEGRVLIFIHKETKLATVEERFPAQRYVLIDDKLRILAAVKSAWRDRVFTVMPRQGHYAHDPQMLGAYAPADLTIERIGDLLEHKLGSLQR